MEIKNFKDFLYDLALNMEDRDKFELICNCSDYVSEPIFYNDKYGIRDIFEEDALEKVLDALDAGQYNRKDMYFTIDAYGYIQTFNDIDEYYDIFDLITHVEDEYLDEYEDYLSDVLLYDIDNKEDLDKFREVVELEGLIDNFADEIDEKSLELDESRVS